MPRDSSTYLIMGRDGAWRRHDLDEPGCIRSEDMIVLRVSVHRKGEGVQAPRVLVVRNTLQPSRQAPYGLNKRVGR